MRRKSSLPDERARLAMRQQLLEAEAAVQRAALAATFEAWGRRPTAAMGTALGSAGARLLRVPRLRWLLLASLAARLKRKHDEHESGLH
jgi:hypothetical protein